MKARTPLALVVLALAVTSRTGLAESNESGAESTEAIPRVESVTIDFDALPKGKMPLPPEATLAPLGVPNWSHLPAFKITPVGKAPEGKPSHLHHAAKINRRKKRSTRDSVTMVDVVLTSPTTDALYVSSSGDSEDLSADATLRLPCGKDESVSSVRWETLVTTPSGEARLDVRDVWFDGKTCAIGAGATASVPLKPVAWNNGKPWLYAMRGDNAVTFVLPRVDTLNHDAMAGAMQTMRGDFTRIGVPMGRWGAASISATAPTLSRPDSTSTASETPSSPVEIGIDIVQTMAEKSPSMLVRVRHADTQHDDAS